MKIKNLGENYIRMCWLRDINHPVHTAESNTKNFFNVAVKRVSKKPNRTAGVRGRS